jgi:succinoglycan biosynthesis transport protein ExoP
MAYESNAAGDARIDVAAVLAAVVRRLPRIIFLTVVALGITYAVLAITPREYESTAGILVEPRANAYSRATNEQAPQSGGSEAGVVSSQIELIRSRDTLLRVIESTNLRDEPEFNSGAGGFSPIAIVQRLLGRQPAVAATDEVILINLIDRMSVVQQRDSRVISVTVRSRDPDLAARLANAIANAHVVRRAELSITDTAEASAWLLEEIERLRVSVVEAEQAVADFRVANDLFTGANNTSLLDQQLSTIATQINQAQERKNTALTRATSIRQMIEQGLPIDTVADVQASAVVQQLTQERARLQGERALLQATLLPNHPNVRAIVAQIGELDIQLRAEAVRIADSLEAEANIQAGIETALNGELETLKQGVSTATRESVTLQGLVREATAQRELLESYLRRYSEASSRSDTNSALPDVRVISVAAPPVNPSSPQVTMTLLAVGIVMLAGQLGLIIFIELLSGRALRPAYSVAPTAPVAAPVFAAPPAPAPVMTTDRMPIEPAEEVREEQAAETEEIVPDVTLEGQGETDRMDFTAPIEAAPQLDPAPQPELDAEPLSAVVPPLASELHAEPEAEAARESAVLPDPSQILADLTSKRIRTLVVVGVGSEAVSGHLVTHLTRELLDAGVSVALVDAGSRRKTEESGISDLSLGAVSFGDVVHKNADIGFAEVPWGRSAEFDLSSSRPLTLVEALGDLYEVVLVSTGPIGRRSTLSAFTDVADRVVLVSADGTTETQVADLRTELDKAGYRNVTIVREPAREAA